MTAEDQDLDVEAAFWKRKALQAAAEVARLKERLRFGPVHIRIVDATNGYFRLYVNDVLVEGWETLAETERFEQRLRKAFESPSPEKPVVDPPHIAWAKARQSAILARPAMYGGWETVEMEMLTLCELQALHRRRSDRLLRAYQMFLKRKGCSQYLAPDLEELPAEQRMGRFVSVWTEFLARFHDESDPLALDSPTQKEKP